MRSSGVMPYSIMPSELPGFHQMLVQSFVLTSIRNKSIKTLHDAVHVIHTHSHSVAGHN